MASTAVDQLPPGAAVDSQFRRKSVAAIELKDDHGRRRTVHLEELSEADRELAEKFGYNPVNCQLHSSMK